WSVILLTVFIKIVLFPLDFYQRKKTLDNAAKMKIMEPELEKIRSHFAGDKQKINEATMALYKKHGYGMFYACLPLIATMFIFITLFTGFTSISRTMNEKLVDELQSSYDVAYAAYTTKAGVVAEEDIFDPETEDFIERRGYFAPELLIKASGHASGFEDFYIAKEIYNERAKYKKKDMPSDDALEAAAREKLADTGFNPDAVYDNGTIYLILKESGAELAGDAYLSYAEVANYLAQAAVLQTYNEEIQSFVWIKNVWIADVPWKKPIPDFADYQKLVGEGSGVPKNTYIKITEFASYENRDAVNGFLILVVLAVGLNFLSQFIMQKQQKNAPNPMGGGAGGPMGAGGSMKMLMYLMPLMIGGFALSYSSAFTLYMVTNALMTVLLNLLSTGILKLTAKKKDGGGGSSSGKTEKIRIIG
ncbi:MAG: YidC/Oxa1 family membrane protein insertase, partial [Firmicutes bacterium]|nr:YidC/Oxa1 family membrane protein insertase [Bacillota bacterium]